MIFNTRYNFAIKGGFSGGEDCACRRRPLPLSRRPDVPAATDTGTGVCCAPPASGADRWKETRRWFPGVQFEVFNLVFICFFQHALILGAAR